MKHYTTLAGLFAYPDASIKSCVAEVKKLLANQYPELLGLISNFETHVNTTDIREQCEYFIKTFDIQALCFLDIGYVLFGEDLKRGGFLVHMIDEHRNADNDYGIELPDHLPNMLRLLPKIKDRAFADELAFSIMIPALKEMLKNFSTHNNVYRETLQMLLCIMESDFKNLKYRQFTIAPKDKSNFLDKIGCNPGACKSGKKNKTIC